MDADGHAVHLRFQDVLDAVAAELLAEGRVERAELGQRVFVLGAIAFVAVGFSALVGCPAASTLSSESIGTRCLTRANFSLGAPPTRWVGDSGVTNSGKFLFQILQFLEKNVVIPVADGRAALDIVGMIVPPDFIGQFGVTGFGVVESQRNLGSLGV